MGFKKKSYGESRADPGDRKGLYGPIRELILIIARNANFFNTARRRKHKRKLSEQPLCKG